MKALCTIRHVLVLILLNLQYFSLKDEKNERQQIILPTFLKIDISILHSQVNDCTSLIFDEKLMAFSSSNSV